VAYFDALTSNSPSLNLEPTKMAGQPTAILDLLFDQSDGVLTKENFPEIPSLDFVSRHWFFVDMLSFGFGYAYFCKTCEL